MDGIGDVVKDKNIFLVKDRPNNVVAVWYSGTGAVVVKGMEEVKGKMK